MVGASPLSTPWMVLSPAYLDGFSFYASDGSLIAPRLGNDGTGRMPLLGSEAARELETSSFLVLEEVHRYWRSLPLSERRLPHPLPGMGGWSLERFVGRAASFSKGSRHVEIEFGDRAYRQYTVSRADSRAEVCERVTIDTTGYGVLTDFYGFRRRFRNFTRAVQFAWLVSAFVYDVDLYHPLNELGPLLFRSGEAAHEEEVPHRWPVVIPISDLDPRSEVSFASARSVLETSPGGFREAVAGASVTPARDGSYDVSLTLYRPPERGPSRMPLKQRLRRVLWDPLAAKIGV